MNNAPIDSLSRRINVEFIAHFSVMTHGRSGEFKAGATSTGFGVNSLELNSAPLRLAGVAIPPLFLFSYGVRKWMGSLRFCNSR